jgi:hypothetical protein
VEAFVVEEVTCFGMLFSLSSATEIICWFMLEHEIAAAVGAVEIEE